MKAVIDTLWKQEFFMVARSWWRWPSWWWQSEDFYARHLRMFFGFVVFEVLCFGISGALIVYEYYGSEEADDDDAPRGKTRNITHNYTQDYDSEEAGDDEDPRGLTSRGIVILLLDVVLLLSTFYFLYREFWQFINLLDLVPPWERSFPVLLPVLLGCKKSSDSSSNDNSNSTPSPSTSGSQYSSEEEKKAIKKALYETRSINRAGRFADRFGKRRFEFKQLRDHFFTSPWNLCEFLTHLLVAICALSHFIGTLTGRRMAHDTLMAIMAITTVPMLGTTLGFLRGIDPVDWLINVLIRNMHDMGSFALVLFTLMAFAAVAFLLLFSSNPSAGEDDADDDITANLGAFPEALLAMFTMGIIGETGTGGFSETANPVLTHAFFVSYITLVMVIALNALIAILGQSYAEAQAAQEATRVRLRAELILDYLQDMSNAEYDAICGKVGWTHRLVPEGLDMKEVPQKPINDKIEAADDKMGAVIKEVEKMREMMMGEMDAKMAEMKHEVAKMDAKMDDIKNVLTAIRPPPLPPTLAQNNSA